MTIVKGNYGEKEEKEPKRMINSKTFKLANEIKDKLAKKMSPEKIKRSMFLQTVKKREQDYKKGTMAQKDRESYRSSHLVDRK